MFTGIIEATGILETITRQGTNRSFWVGSPVSHALKPDQSVAHDGVCLTVEEVSGDRHRVTAVHETLLKTNLGTRQPGDAINLERCMQLNGRLDGHLVQGHVDTTATCTAKQELNGSWEYSFAFPGQFSSLVIEKGSISLNGTSLTIFDVTGSTFRIAVIPYTFNHTNIRFLQPGSTVNIEFDMIGKYVSRMMGLKNETS